MNRWGLSLKKAQNLPKLDNNRIGHIYVVVKNPELDVN